MVFHLCYGTALLFPDINLSDFAADVHSRPGKRLIDWLSWKTLKLLKILKIASLVNIMAVSFKKTSSSIESRVIVNQCSVFCY